MTPIAKNIFVIDEQGNHYKATYPKRAKGLVKKGRARFFDENTICLACPPNEYLEETTMEENKETTIINSQESQEMTAADVLKRIDNLRFEMSYLNDALQRISTLVEAELNLPCADQVHLVTKAEAMRDTVMARETTIQKFLAFYEKVYDDCKSDKLNAKQKLVIDMMKAVPNLPEAPDFASMIHAVDAMNFD